MSGKETELVNVRGDDLKKLRDLKTTTDLPLIVDACETTLNSLSCNSAIGVRIEELGVRACRLNSLVGLACLKNLRVLDVGNNQLKTIADRDDSQALLLEKLIADHNEIGVAVMSPRFQQLSFVGFPALVHLDLSANNIERLNFASTLGTQLKVFKFSNNSIDTLCEFYHLRALENLEEIEFEGNPCNDALTDQKLMILTKAMIIGKLEVVNGIHINEQQQLLAESLHVHGIRKFKPDKFTHDDLVAFVMEVMEMLRSNAKQLEMVSSQQRINSGRKTSLLSSRPKSTYDHTPTLHRQTTKTPVSRRSIRSMSAMPRINLNFDDQTSDEKINISSNRTSNDQPTTSKIQDETRENFEKLFSMLNAQQSEIESLKAENSKLREEVSILNAQQSEIESPKVGNAKLRETIVRLENRMEALTDYISIVPSNLRIRKRAGKKESEFILEWDNELKAAHNVRGYELELGDGQIYKVMAPQRRVVLENPVDGQKIALRAIHKTNDKLSDDQEFVFKMPNEDKENQQ